MANNHEEPFHFHIYQMDILVVMLIHGPDILSSVIKHRFTQLLRVSLDLQLLADFLGK